jgi:RimJ/RimL family protein N-acetyltransferase
MIVTAIDLQPTLTGTLMMIRPIETADWEGMFAAASDPDVWALHPEIERYTEPVFREFFDGAINSGSAFTFVDRESGEIIGSSRYFGHDPMAREIEIGWTFLTRACWGGSYNREAKKLMLEHAFQFVDMVVFRIGVTNWRSQRATEKIGGVKRDDLHAGAPTGQSSENVIYEIHKGDFRL